jgi:hypothetical protein
MLDSSAQSKEFGLMVGGSNYHGDLAYNIVPAETQFSGGAFYKYNFNEFWSIRPTVSYLQISGSDQNFEENRLRNLSFRNNIYEFSTVFEFNFKPFSARTIHESTSFYAMMGLAGFMHKPEAELNGVWYDLHAQNTEQLSPKNKYKLFQISVPFGGGLKHALTKNVVVGFEAGWRKTFTDYIDDVSTVYPDLRDPNNPVSLTGRQLSDRSWEVSEQGTILSNAGDMRGDPNLKDWYFQTAFSISYRFTPIQCPYKRIHFFD